MAGRLRAPAAPRPAYRGRPGAPPRPPGRTHDPPRSRRRPPRRCGAARSVRAPASAPARAFTIGKPSTHLPQRVAMNPKSKATSQRFSTTCSTTLRNQGMRSISPRATLRPCSGPAMCTGWVAGLIATIRQITSGVSKSGSMEVFTMTTSPGSRGRATSGTARAARQAGTPTTSGRRGGTT